MIRKSRFQCVVYLLSLATVCFSMKNDAFSMAKDISAEEYHNDQGIYPLISDAHRIQYQNKTTTLTFKGYINDELVVNQEFKVGADCCHVSLITGNREIVLD